MENPSEVIYCGVTYRRNSESDQRSHRVYYTVRRDDGRGVLHRDIYTDHHGLIPEGWHVHHKDHDPFNNDPSNLVALSPSEHKRVHPGSHDLSSEEWLAHLEAIRPLAAAWHSSPEGLAWHSEHGLRTWENRTPVVIEQTCANCDGPVETYRKGGGVRYCSQRCLNAHAERTGKYLKAAECPICGTEFGQRRGRPKTCGLACGAKLGHSRRT